MQVSDSMNDIRSESVQDSSVSGLATATPKTFTSDTQLTPPQALPHYEATSSYFEDLENLPGGKSTGIGQTVSESCSKPGSQSIFNECKRLSDQLTEAQNQRFELGSKAGKLRIDQLQLLRREELLKADLSKLWLSQACLEQDENSDRARYSDIEAEMEADLRASESITQVLAQKNERLADLKRELSAAQETFHCKKLEEDEIEEEYQNALNICYDNEEKQKESVSRHLEEDRKRLIKTYAEAEKLQEELRAEQLSFEECDKDVEEMLSALRRPGHAFRHVFVSLLILLLGVLCGALFKAYGKVDIAVM